MIERKGGEMAVLLRELEKIGLLTVEMFWERS